MLEPAIKYKEELERLQYAVWFQDKYQYWNCSNVYESIAIDDNTWNRNQFVSVFNGKVIGYISYCIDRGCNNVYQLGAINFTEHKAAFGKDLGQALKDIFEKYGFRKINFVVVIGNPIEKTYDKMITKYGGRIVGIMSEDVKLLDGSYHDRKMYEISAKKYFAYKEARKRRNECD